VSDDVTISRMQASDAGEILTIQRAAFVSEALIYGDPDMPPLVQTLEELQAEIADGDGWVARVGPRLVGVLRCRDTDELLLIGRIAIAPDMQGSGIGGGLLEAAEQHSRAPQAELFTGSLSEANLRLYERCGYRITERVDNGDGTEQVFMRKRIREGAGERHG
jgi:GNAT superfamily N-acetyltransferase